MDTYSTGIIGIGKVGSALAGLLSTQHRLDWIIARTDSSYQRAVNILNDKIPVLRNVSEIEFLPDIIILTVNDNEIEGLSKNLADKFRGELNNKIILHCSGTIPASVLDPCLEKGAITAAAHPYQTFYNPSPNLLNGICWGVEPNGNFEIISKFIKSIGGKAYNLNGISKKDKALYHASAVAVSNYMTILFELSKEIGALINLPVEDFLPPIARTTLENNINSLSNPNDFPLTGPIARGDFETISRHLEALKSNPELADIYSLIGLAAAKVAHSKGLVDDNSYHKIVKLLK